MWRHTLNVPPTSDLPDERVPAVEAALGRMHLYASYQCVLFPSSSGRLDSSLVSRGLNLTVQGYNRVIALSTSLRVYAASTTNLTFVELRVGCVSFSPVMYR